MGLYYAKQAVQKSGGEIKVKSSGGSTTFSILLDATKVEDQAMAAKAGRDRAMAVTKANAAVQAAIRTGLMTLAITLVPSATDKKTQTAPSSPVAAQGPGIPQQEAQIRSTIRLLVPVKADINEEEVPRENAGIMLAQLKKLFQIDPVEGLRFFDHPALEKYNMDYRAMGLTPAGGIIRSTPGLEDLLIRLISQRDQLDRIQRHGLENFLYRSATSNIIKALAQEVRKAGMPQDKDTLSMLLFSNAIDVPNRPLAEEYLKETARGFLSRIQNDLGFLDPQQVDAINQKIDKLVYVDNFPQEGPFSVASNYNFEINAEQKGWRVLQGLLVHEIGHNILTQKGFVSKGLLERRMLGEFFPETLAVAYAGDVLGPVEDTGKGVEHVWAVLQMRAVADALKRYGAGGSAAEQQALKKDILSLEVNETLQGKAPKTIVMDIFQRMGFGEQALTSDLMKDGRTRVWRVDRAMVVAAVDDHQLERVFPGVLPDQARDIMTGLTAKYPYWDIPAALEVPDEELVRRYPQDKGEGENWDHYVANAHALRGQFLLFLSRVADMDMTAEDFVKVLRSLHRVHLLGVDGKTLYRPVTSKWLIDEQIRGMAGALNRFDTYVKSPSSDWSLRNIQRQEFARFLKRYKDLFEMIRDLKEIGKKQENIKEAVAKIAEFYMITVRERQWIFLQGAGSNSFFMNLVNAFLRLNRLKGISHGYFEARFDEHIHIFTQDMQDKKFLEDFLGAIKTANPWRADELPTVDEVVRILGKEGKVMPAARFDRAMAGDADRAWKSAMWRALDHTGKAIGEIGSGVVIYDPYKDGDYDHEVVPSAKEILDYGDIPFSFLKERRRLIGFGDGFGLVMLNSNIHTDTILISRGYLSCCGIAVRARHQKTGRIDFGLAHILSERVENSLLKLLLKTQRALSEDGYEVLEYMVSYQTSKYDQDRGNKTEAEYERATRGSFQRQYPGITIAFQSRRDGDEENIAVDKDGTAILKNGDVRTLKWKSISAAGADRAMAGKAKKGGIDLNAVEKNLQTQNTNGEIKFNVDPAMLEQLQNAPGFVPVIINIQPLNNLSEFLGIAVKSHHRRP